jgi:hypothetical protein
MSVTRAVKFSWKEACLIAVLAILLAASLHQLYRGYAYHVIDRPWVIVGPKAATLAGQPFQFAVSSAIFAVLSIVAPVFLWSLTVTLRVELRNFRARETRPPLDDAIRQPIDER